jgi:NAD(P)-dependent dehydrogenase (short-subunit alcohol dehydrogenase family)
MSRLRNKATLITGGTSGIGLATARRFLEEGARVAITGTDKGRLEDARNTLGDNVLIIAADAGSVAAQDDIAQQIGAAFGNSMLSSSTQASLTCVRSPTGARRPLTGAWPSI